MLEPVVSICVGCELMLAVAVAFSSLCYRLADNILCTLLLLPRSRDSLEDIWNVLMPSAIFYFSSTWMLEGIFGLIPMELRIND